MAAQIILDPPICHGKKGELYHRYERGLENQLSALGLVLNCVVLWTTVYLDAAVRQLKAQGYPVPGRGHGPPVPVRLHPPARPRHLRLRPARPARRRHPRTTRPRRHRRGRRVNPETGASAGRRRGALLVVFAQHPQNGRGRGVPAVLLALGDDEPGSGVAQAQVLLAQVQGYAEHGVVGDDGAADGLALGTGGLVAFQGAVAVSYTHLTLPTNREV